MPDDTQNEESEEMLMQIEEKLLKLLNRWLD